MTAIADATDQITVEQLAQTVSDLQEIVESQADQIDDLESELAEYRNHNERDKARIRQKITSVEDTVDDIEQDLRADEPAGKQDENGDATDSGNPETDTETPLETICALPEHMAARELSANQERARFIATDVRDYAEKAPAGLIVDSRAIKRVIAAKEGDRPHTQTVARIMDFLDRLGKDAVELRNRRGRKLVAIDPEAADRLSECAGANHDRCDQGRGATPTENVIGSV